MIRNVLFVDDDREMLQALKEGLEKYRETFNVVLAEDGFDAVSKLKKNQISLVVTDLKMPNMDGFEFAAKVKGDNRFSHLKIIALTSLAGDEDRTKGALMGIDDYQIKLDREKLIESLKNILAG